TIANNSCERFGAGINSFVQPGGSIEIVATTINDNHAIKTSNPDSGYAGGISVTNRGGIVSIDQCTISTNSADLEGGGIWVDNAIDDSVIIRRSTITQNVADFDNNLAGSGGGVFVYRGN